MSEIPSSNAIIYAILALNSEIALQKDYINSSEIELETREEEQETLDDLEQALMEFIEIYKQRRHRDPKLPALEDLLMDEL